VITIAGGFMSHALTPLPVVALLFAASLAIQAADVKKQGPPIETLQSEYRLGAEDVIDVFVWKEPEVTASAVVRPDGKISLPLAGELQASGKTTGELQQEIVIQLHRYITDPVVNVIVKQVNSMKISVLGEVHKPDVYRIHNQVTVLDAIAMAGGFTEFAKRSKVIVIRGSGANQQKIMLNIRDAVVGGAVQMYLQPLDTVYVQ
jgi:polysaccharide biosynthesis/export protein